MKKCVVVSDSFKSTLSSRDIIGIVARVMPEYFPGCQLVGIPIADGGEGTVQCFIDAAGASAVEADAHGPYGERRRGVYARMGSTAIIEMAAVAGLPLVGDRPNPSLTSTFGVGELISHALSEDCTEIYLGLGGSATNDGGCGCAAALGVKFFDSEGQSFVPVGATLKNIASIDVSAAEEKLRGVSITVMSDVLNPMFGEAGAAYVFAPQKGADADMVRFLDEGLRHLNDVFVQSLGFDAAELSCGGAAGAMGAGAAAMLGGKICSGIESILKLVNFDAELSDADLVITGEGRLDSQSLSGKLISGVAKHTKAAGTPLVAIVGCIGEGAEGIYELGVNSVFQTNRLALPFEQIRHRAAADYESTLRDIFSLISAMDK